MENALIVGIATATLLGILTGVKTELMKSLVSRITGSKYSFVGIIVGIFAVSVLSGVLSTYFPQSEKTTASSEPEKSELAQDIEAGIEAFDHTRDFVSDIQENRSDKDSIYHATRERKWVYQIGDIVTNEDLLFDIYMAIHNPEGVGVFQVNKNKYFLFKEDCGDEATMSSSLEAFELACGAGLDCRVIDLVSYCDRKQKLHKIDNLKIKEDGEKLLLPCYACGK